MFSDLAGSEEHNTEGDVCGCLCERETEREREFGVCMGVYVCVWIFMALRLSLLTVYVCVRR